MTCISCSAALPPPLRVGVREYRRKFCNRSCYLNHHVATNSEKIAGIKRRSEQRRKAYISAYIVRNREKIRRREKNNALKRQYGICVEDFERMLVIQGGKCLICDSTGTRSLAVDHDHITGKVRGLLCFDCNTALGKFKDSPQVLRRAANYLERSVNE